MLAQHGLVRQRLELVDELVTAVAPATRERSNGRIPGHFRSATPASLPSGRRPHSDQTTGIPAVRQASSTRTTGWTTSLPSGAPPTLSMYMAPPGSAQAFCMSRTSSIVFFGSIVFATMADRSMTSSMCL